MSERFDVTVVVPCYNSADWIVDALESVRRQTIMPAEVVVIDDGSTDESGAVTEKAFPEVRLIRQDNRGLAAARNRGLAASRTEWVTFLDADDFWHPRHLESLVEAIQSDACIEAAGTTCQFFCTPEDRDDLMLEYIDLSHVRVVEPLEYLDRGWESDEPGSDVRVPTHENWIMSNHLQPNVMVKRDLLITAGGFPTEASLVEDWAAWLSLRRFTPIHIIDSRTFFYRQRPGSLSRQRAMTLASMVNLVPHLYGGVHMPLTGRLPSNLGSSRRWGMRAAFEWALESESPKEAVRIVRALGQLHAGSRREIAVQRLVELQMRVRAKSPALSKNLGRVGLLRRALYGN